MTITEKFPHISRSVSVDNSVKITGDVYIRENCRLGNSVYLHAKDGRLVIGENSKIGSQSELSANGERTTIGKNVEIGENCNISTSIGDNTVIGDNVTIKSNCSIGNDCTILDNQILEDMTIPDGSKVNNAQIIQ